MHVNNVQSHAIYIIVPVARKQLYLELECYCRTCITFDIAHKLPVSFFSCLFSACSLLLLR